MPAPSSPNSARDHPRIRGEHDPHCATHECGPGSSPHTRGALRRAPRVGCAVRIIPAYAGSTQGMCPTSPPRGGSSPHTRGAQYFAYPRHQYSGIIPAYAGSTEPAPHPSATRPDHPRIRGEHCQAILPVSSLAGSSPHTRGARLHNLIGDPGVRIIPAYAGSTPPNVRRYDSRQDHPRIRGEHIDLRAAEDTTKGSSPHTRGALVLTGGHPPDKRIIPAYAGSTTMRSFLPGGAADHPRIRGEHRERPPRLVLLVGSSPHTRGAPMISMCGAGTRGIIPAYAGSTSDSFATRGSARDHPRIRGEHLNSGAAHRVAQGSSPHTRGAPFGRGKNRVS